MPSDRDPSSLKPSRGMEFEHATWLDGSNQPLRCRVTAIRRGCVYYRPIQGGAPMVCDQEEFHRYVKRVLLPEG